jgi:hypothetical protein
VSITSQLGRWAAAAASEIREMVKRILGFFGAATAV